MNDEKQYTQADLDYFAANADDYFKMAMTYRGCLEWLADVHHRTLNNSKLHDPEHIDSFKNCPCLTCKRVTEVLGET